ncbi:hypothetical protein [Mahella sp.]|uniref:hypothetical protein n=1 Tax=Mahella sp. TaxID=2798721 RepID=UPI0025C647E8|nr:hypothetical protein [Mahella sp.]MBZ4666812.1 putative metal dependent phosphohydrolase domain protein [Mahella sp.]
MAVADIYDAMTSDRVYKKEIAIYPRGCQVLLSTNEIGIVIDSNRSMPLRPVVNIITDRNRVPLKVPKKVELELHPDIVVTQIFY